MLSLQPGLAGSLKFHQEPQNFIFSSDRILKCYNFPYLHFARTRGLLMPFHYPRDCFDISCSFLFITLSRTYCANQATNLVVRVRHNNFAPKLTIKKPNFSMETTRYFPPTFIKFLAEVLCFVKSFPLQPVDCPSCPALFNIITFWPILKHSIRRLENTFRNSSFKVTEYYTQKDTWCCVQTYCWHSDKCIAVFSCTR